MLSKSKSSNNLRPNNSPRPGDRNSSSPQPMRHNRSSSDLRDLEKNFHPRISTFRRFYWQEKDYLHEPTELSGKRKMLTESTLGRWDNLINKSFNIRSAEEHETKLQRKISAHSPSSPINCDSSRVLFPQKNVETPKFTGLKVFPRESLNNLASIEPGRESSKDFYLKQKSKESFEKRPYNDVPCLPIPGIDRSAAKMNMKKYVRELKGSIEFGLENIENHNPEVKSQRKMFIPSNYQLASSHEIQRLWPAKEKSPIRKNVDLWKNSSEYVDQTYKVDTYSKRIVDHPMNRKLYKGNEFWDQMRAGTLPTEEDKKHLRGVELQKKNFERFPIKRQLQAGDEFWSDMKSGRSLYPPPKDLLDENFKITNKSFARAISPLSESKVPERQPSAKKNNLGVKPAHIRNLFQSQIDKIG